MDAHPAAPAVPGFGVIARTDRVTFWPLPTPMRSDGAPRRTGVEIEFAGLSEGAAAEVVRGLWGGTVEGADPSVVRGGRHGPVRVIRDSALARSGAEGMLLSALGDLVPIEIVTAPLPPEALVQVDRLVAGLRAGGARGTRDAVRFGFGVHFNVELTAATPEALLPVVRAFALLEDWLRASDPPDPARRLLPFVDPWPRALIDGLAADGAGWDIDTLTAQYLALTPSRNRGLDLLPVLEHLRPHTVRAALAPGQAKGGRPTFHYRLPEARVDEDDWSLAYEWNRWVIVERVAARAGLLAALAEEWQAHRAALLSIRPDWARTVEDHLMAARIWEG